MGTLTRLYTFVAGAVPTAAQWNADPAQFITLVNGNLDEANIDTTSADGIVGMSVEQSVSNGNPITGIKSFTGLVNLEGGLVINEASADVDTRLETNGLAYAFYADGGKDAIVFGANTDISSTDTPFLIDHAARTATAATNFDRFKVGGSNAVTIPAGTTALVTGAHFAEPNITATGTVTKAVTVYIAGAPTEGGTNHALEVAAGNVELGGTLGVTGIATFTANPVFPETKLYGGGSDGSVANPSDQDYQATTLDFSGGVTPSHNRVWQATGAVAIDQTITVGRQDGQARGSLDNTIGGPGIDLGAIFRAIGSHGMPQPMRPGADGTGLVGGVLQILAAGNIDVGGAITAVGTNASGDGGGGGGLVVLVSAGTISGSSAIDVSGGDANATAAAAAGGGGYSGAPGGHAGFGGSGGGDAYIGDTPGAAGDGFVAGQAGGGGFQGGGGGGCIDNVGDTTGSTAGADGGDGDAYQSVVRHKESIFGPRSEESSWTAATAGSASGCCAGGAAGSNGGGGGGGGGRPGSAGASGANGGNGGDGGAGGGAGGACNVSGTAGNGGNGAAGSTFLYALSSKSPYAGLPGGQGGGGSGGRGQLQNGCTNGGAGTGGSGAAGITAFIAGMGAGDGGAGAAGETEGTGDGHGGDGGAGGNGGGAAGLVIMIANSVTYSGTVTGRHVVITGTDAEDLLRTVFPV